MIPKTINKNLVTPSKTSPDHVFIRDCDVPAPTGTDLGLDTFFELTAIFTPRYVSTRNHQHDKDDSLYTKDDVERITKLIGRVSLVDSDAKSIIKQEQEETKQNEEKETDEVKSMPTKVHSEPNAVKEESTVGRIDCIVFSEKAKGKVPVKRSRRLTENTKI